MRPNAPVEPGVWSCLSPASDKSRCKPSEKVGLAPILFNWNHFSPFITLPVSETYLRLRSVGEKKKDPFSVLWILLKIHKSRGLVQVFITMRILIFYVRIADRRYFFFLPSCSILPYQSINTLAVWQEGRRALIPDWCWWTQIQPNHITCIFQRRRKRGAFLL